MLTVLDRQPTWIKGKDKQSFGVCIQTPLYDFKNFLKLVEAFEMYKILGARHVTMYNYTGDPVLNHVLEAYVAQGFLDVIQWPLPREIRVNVSDDLYNEGVYYYAKLAAVQDCLYRNMHKFKYIVFMDTDEVIVPRNTRVWMKMIKSLPQNVSAYYFRRAEFILNSAVMPGENSDERLIKYHPASILARQRIRLIYEFKKKCCFKSIVKPEKIWTMNVHWAEKAMGPIHETDSEKGLTHHYRPNRKSKRPQIVDPYMGIYQDQLIRNIDNLIQNIAALN
ncbi:glycosyltransferase family 92 protein F13G3.3-like [Lingula anatina]|uniref:Glycosyltransferase family 92 protein n=1 Tax=Lingula anatina TaxID=7574 RepID=A0A1S3JSK1_LINAN|nr:glycosyltransferase family 92 protein F13G3.3-like [Lingula anatina]|eukprot:XP_013413101.1 glycosyltransferase family 92 protein F13G3.3-like [Lingula anatina]